MQSRLRLMLSPIAMVPSATPALLFKASIGTEAFGQAVPTQLAGPVQLNPAKAELRRIAPVEVSGPLLVTTMRYVLVAPRVTVSSA